MNYRIGIAEVGVALLTVALSVGGSWVAMSERLTTMEVELAVSQRDYEKLEAEVKEKGQVNNESMRAIGEALGGIQVVLGILSTDLANIKDDVGDLKKST